MQPDKIDDVMEKLRSLPPERIEEVADFVDFLKQRMQAKRTDKREPLDFPVISVGQWPEDMSLSREDMYGDDGR
ncbi:MAG TPA: DUF2281 domain-containing protein [Gammaproteobacteria bacterium]